MANETYDPEGEGSQGSPANRSTGNRGEESTPTADDILNQEQQAGSGRTSNRDASPSGLNQAEERGDSPIETSGLLFHEGDEEKRRRGRVGGAFEKGRNARNSFFGRLAKLATNKWLVGGLVGTSTIIIFLVIALLLIAGSNKITSFVEHMASYQFARTTRQMSLSVNKVSAEKMGIQLMTDDEYSRARLVYAQASGKVSQFWSKFDTYRPEKMISNYRQADRLQFNTEEGRFGRQKLVSVRLDGQTVPIQRSTIKNNLIPGYKFVGDIEFSKNFAPVLNEALKTSDVGVITRTKIAYQIRKELNIKLTAWSVGKYTGLTDDEAKAALQRDGLRIIEGNEDTSKVTSKGPIQDATDEAEEKRAEAIKDADNLRNPQNIERIVTETVEQKLTVNGLQQAFSSFENSVRAALNVVNPVYAVATPMCLIYEGSVVSSGPSMQKSMDEQQRKGVLMAAAASQQKEGGNRVAAEAVQAYNWKAGDVMQSNAEIRASGQRVDTTDYQSAQASPTGSYSTSLADLIPNKEVADFMDAQAGTLCPIFTNLWAGVGLGVANIAVTALSGGSAAAPQAAVQASAQTGIRAAVSKITARLVAAKSTGVQFAKDTAKTGAIVAGGTLIARQIVMANTGANHDSLATGKPFLDDADSGFNMYANQQNQQMFYGAPLSDDELDADNKANKLQMALVESQKSPFERYLDTDNPNSLLTRTAMATNSFFSKGVFEGVFNLMGSLLSPMKTVGNTMGTAFTGTAFADEPITSANTYYGNVQFGYTDEENSIISNDLSFRPVKNQEILDTSGKEEEISTVYKPCFDGSKRLSELLTTKGKNQDGNDEYWIVRNGDGDIIGGICSQKNVGPRNDKYGNLVFRWRLSNCYANTLDQMIDQQTITKNREGEGQPEQQTEDSSADVSGDVQTVAKEILANKNISFPQGFESAGEDVRLAAEGKKGTGGAPFNIKALQLVAALGKDHKVTVTAYQSNGGGHSAGSDHYTGDAVDIDLIDGKEAYQTITDYWDIIKPYSDGAVFLQGHCMGAKKPPQGMKREIGDACNHQHISFKK